MPSRAAQGVQDRAATRVLAEDRCGPRQSRRCGRRRPLLDAAARDGGGRAKPVRPKTAGIGFDPTSITWSSLMTVQSNFSAIRGVPLEHLFLSPLNVRKNCSEKNIPDLAKSIELKGVLQNLAGYEDHFTDGKRQKDGIGIVAGGRRWRALQWLLNEGKIKKNYIVPCLVTSKEAAIAISLAENSDREDLHPADEFEAARALVDAGRSIEQVAEQLRLSPLTVQRRLKLANVAPQFVQLYRDTVISLEHLMAFAVTDDHEKQQQVWKGLPAHGRTPSRDSRGTDRDRGLCPGSGGPVRDRESL